MSCATVVALQRGNLTLELQRRVPSGQDHLLSVAEVETWKRQDRDELQATFERMLELAGDFDLQLLGHKRLTELIALEPGRMRKAIRAARREHEERWRSPCCWRTIRASSTTTSSTRPAA